MNRSLELRIDIAVIAANELFHIPIKILDG